MYFSLSSNYNSELELSYLFIIQKLTKTNKASELIEPHILCSEGRDY